MKTKHLITMALVAGLSTVSFAETRKDADRTSCQAIKGQYLDGYCLVSAKNIAMPSDAHWVEDELGSAYSLVQLDGKYVIVYEGILPRSKWRILEVIVHLLTSDDIACSGRYSC